MSEGNPLPSLKEKDIFWEALNQSSPESCAEYLARVCGDDQKLRESVEDLIKNHKGDDFFDKLPQIVHRIEQVGEAIGDKIDRYKLLEVIGEGGCGLVYLADQQEPFYRQVAVKVIRLGMDTRQVITRFEAERQALATLEHSYIAKVFDAGTTSNGRPYFVMELVRGKKITEYSDHERLTIVERLDLFVKVCRAVHHAHQKGFIHRDIKPSNILVLNESGEHLPKVIDFGIAKTLTTDVSQNITSAGQIIGTLGYMGPEQAEAGERKIDARTDVYSLGMLLYELLTNHLPWELTQLSQYEQLRKIIEDKPELPSFRFSELPEEKRLEIAELRGIGQSELVGLLKDDLDWIAEKCLEKSQENRFQTAEELGMAIQGCLDKLRGSPSLSDAAPNQGGKSTGKQNKKLPALIISIIVMGIAVSFAAKLLTNSKAVPEGSRQDAMKEEQRNPVPDPSTAEGLLTMMVQSFDGDKQDISTLKDYQTENGQLVWGWLVQQHWFRGKGMGRIIERKPPVNNREELILLYDYPDGTEKLSVIFFIEKGILKFHDIYLFDMKGDHFDMFLSHLIEDPFSAKAEFALKNPGKVFRGVFGK